MKIRNHVKLMQRCNCINTCSFHFSACKIKFAMHVPSIFSILCLLQCYDD